MSLRSDLGHPFVPVLVHEVIDHTAGGLGQIGVEVACVAGILHVADNDNVFFVRRQQES